jgi:hypothetical protein
VQDFIPTPMSMATSMYYTGQDPFSREPVYTAKTMHEKRMQKALLQYWDPAQHELAREALVQAGRRDLIGSKAHQLVPPASGAGALSIHARGRGPARPSGRLGRRGSGVRGAKR